MCAEWTVSFASRSGNRLSYKMRPLPSSARAVAVIVSTSPDHTTQATTWMDELEEARAGVFFLDLGRNTDPVPGLPGVGAVSMKPMEGRPTPNLPGAVPSDASSPHPSEKDQSKGPPPVATLYDDLLDFLGRTGDTMAGLPVCLVGFGRGAQVALHALSEALGQNQRQHQPSEDTMPKKTYGPRSAQSRSSSFSVRPKEVDLQFAVVGDLPETIREVSDLLESPKVLELDPSTEDKQRRAAQWLTSVTCET